MKNKNLIIILVLFLFIVGVISVYFILNTNDNNVKENIGNSTKNINKSKNITNDYKVNSNNNKAKNMKNNDKSQNKSEPILIRKGQAILKTKDIVNDLNLGEKVSKTSKLISIGKKHYWVVSVYNKTNNLKTGDYYINAKTGYSTDPALLAVGV
ncbi:hypothetical protein MBBAR_12c00130 [Methanobrevibacter arboriphilus JCM 13429 = DSM 1125]|uniref:Uncharacterized protein n=2 Tax=Methanobrevibacter arboriphilus TaxID=39441 RepID=A0A1V6N1G9_METAZ|nr:hypothetical protein MBBAR_12c00130 [Methanobrevibacter arboriphilus JCM 13429 = DSM 1125]